MIRTMLTYCTFWALSLVTTAQTGTITNISVQPHTDGSGMIDVHFNLSGEAESYNILIEVSFDAGDTYTPVPTAYLSGDLQGISSGSRQVVWDGYGSFPNEFSTQTRIKIVATADDNGGSNIQPGEGVTDIDGNFYQSVIIGNQEWMAENLKTTKYRNGISIDYPGTDNSAWQNNTTGAYAWLFNDIAWKDSYGALYNWYAVNNSNGLCPTGWHVPSDAEWTELVDYVVDQGYPNSNVVNGAGNALKSCRQVSSPLGGDCATSEHPRWNSHSTHYGTDEFGFSALPGGVRGTDGNCYGLGYYGLWWSSTEHSSVYAWLRGLRNDHGNVIRHYSDNKHPGFSVRCVRDN